MRMLVWRLALVGALGAGLLAVGCAPASAAVLSGHVVVAPVASIFTDIGSALLGAFTWTVDLASKFILVTLGALIKMLIPKSWAQAPISLFEWIVAIPNYAGTVTSPSGATTYGFAGVNMIRELFQWIGIGLAPLSLTYATGRNMTGAGDHLAAPIARILAIAAGLIFYTHWWAQAGALDDQLTHLILSPEPVVSGIRQLMAYTVEGVSLGGWQLIDLGLMAALAMELLALIVVKVIIILLGAILFATGPLLIGVVATEDGAVLAQAWMTSVGVLFAVPVAWSIIFAIGAVLIGDGSTAGPLIGGSSTIGQLLGGVIVAVAGVATLWVCLRACREGGHVLRAQLGVLLASTRRARTGARANAPATTTASPRQATQSVRSFGRQVRLASATRRPTPAATARYPGTAAGGRGHGLAGRATLAGAALRSRAAHTGRAMAGARAQPHARGQRGHTAAAPSPAAPANRQASAPAAGAVARPSIADRVRRRVTRSAADPPTAPQAANGRRARAALSPDQPPVTPARASGGAAGSGSLRTSTSTSGGTRGGSVSTTKPAPGSPRGERAPRRSAAEGERTEQPTATPVVRGVRTPGVGPRAPRPRSPSPRPPADDRNPSPRPTPNGRGGVDGRDDGRAHSGSEDRR